MTVPSGVLRFIIVFPEMGTDGNFSLKDLPGSGKRIDVLCRCLAAGFSWGRCFYSQQKIEVMALIQNELLLTFRHPTEEIIGERDWAAYIKDVLDGNDREFMSVKRMDLITLIRFLQETGNLYILHEEGQPFYSDIIDIASQNSFMLGDHRGFDSKTEEIFDSFEIERISLGSMKYLGSHCIATMVARIERLIEDER